MRDYLQGMVGCDEIARLQDVVEAAVVLLHHVSLNERIIKQMGLNLLYYRIRIETCFGWDPNHQRCWDRIKTHQWILGRYIEHHTKHMGDDSSQLKPSILQNLDGDVFCQNTSQIQMLLHRILIYNMIFTGARVLVHGLKQKRIIKQKGFKFLYAGFMHLNRICFMIYAPTEM